MRWPIRRRTSRLAAAVLLLGALLGALQGCGDAERDPVEQASQTPSASATSTPTPIDILRIGDNGADVALQVGGTATVFLPASYTWEEPVVDGDAVTISQDVSDEGSSSRSWTVTAQRAGTASVTLTGSPVCRSETPSCAEPDVSWTAQFIVQ